MTEKSLTVSEVNNYISHLISNDDILNELVITGEAREYIVDENTTYHITNKAYIWIEYRLVNAINGFDELDDVL